MYAFYIVKPYEITWKQKTFVLNKNIYYKEVYVTFKKPNEIYWPLPVHINILLFFST